LLSKSSTADVPIIGRACENPTFTVSNIVFKLIISTRAIEQARILALEDQQGWSDDGGDGGDPVVRNTPPPPRNIL